VTSGPGSAFRTDIFVALSLANTPDPQEKEPVGKKAVIPLPENALTPSTVPTFFVGDRVRAVLGDAL
jgi:hypothetical protein